MPTVLEANVLSPRGTANHRVQLPDGTTRVGSDVVRLRIEAGESGVFLLRCDRSGLVTDTWHPSVVDAQQQAEFEFALDGDWGAPREPRG